MIVERSGIKVLVWSGTEDGLWSVPGADLSPSEAVLPRAKVPGMAKFKWKEREVVVGGGGMWYSGGKS